MPPHRFPVVSVVVASGLSAAAQDPWPTWQRTNDRLGRTANIGPRTPTVLWSVRVDPSTWSYGLSGAPTIDREGRVFIGHATGVTALDGRSGAIRWVAPISDGIDGSPAIYNGRVYFGSANDYFYCADAASGQLCWQALSAPHPNFSPVVTPVGRVVYTSQLAVMYARRWDTGQLVWSVPIGSSTGTSPSLDGRGQIFTGSEDWGDVAAHRISDGQRVWDEFVGYSNIGTFPVDLAQGPNGQVYCVAGHRVRAFDRVTGAELWEVAPGETLSGQVAVGHDGTVFVPTTCCQYRMLALNPVDGSLLWQYSIGVATKYAPIIDGDGVIYQTAFNSVQRTGQLHAINPDGTRLFVYDFPDMTFASPMLSPEGTLYVICSNRFLYAFRDPDRPWTEDLDPNNPAPPPVSPPRRISP